MHPGDPRAHRALLARQCTRPAPLSDDSAQLSIGHRAQVLEQAGQLPDACIACVGGGLERYWPVSSPHGASLPICVGFGISTPEQARAVGQLAEGVIVGSACVRAIGESAAPVRAAAGFAQAFSAALGQHGVK